ncbi:murein transglycosylase [Rhodobacteraceae bacterium CCMM004]|nr:murein transglycosylase [Rhodobacteraceae bacterium CCMM004]
MRRAAAAAALACVLGAGAPAGAEVTHRILDFRDLRGWAYDDHDAALEVYLETCRDMRSEAWEALCAIADTRPNARAFFETFFRPVLIEDGAPMLFTGYYEPELRGSLRREGPYRHPVYRVPPDLDVLPWYSRAEIEEDGHLDGKGLEIAWVDDPVDAFFLQIQGSGRIRLPDGTALRVGYGGKNGHEYRSVGRELVRRGIYEDHQVSADVIRNWVRRNPQEGAALLRHNPSYVFFREVNEVPPDRGPLGAMNRSVTPLRSIAVDPAHVPLGAPVWIEKAGKAPLRRLTVAQDTGSAIKGAQRADIFYGTGRAAGRAAGQVRDGGRMVALLPIEMAFAFAPGI